MKRKFDKNGRSLNCSQTFSIPPVVEKVFEQIHLLRPDFALSMEKNRTLLWQIVAINKRRKTCFFFSRVDWIHRTYYKV